MDYAVMHDDGASPPAFASKPRHFDSRTRVQPQVELIARLGDSEEQQQVFNAFVS